MSRGRRAAAATPTSPVGGVPDPDYRAFRTIAKQAQRPPMGWNSWDVFGVSVTEAEVRAHARIMAERLLPSGYDHIVLDLGWYSPSATVDDLTRRPEPRQSIDAYGRLIPDLVRFPSAAGGRGFAPLAQEVQGLKLKFGIHVMRGIPIQAVEANTPVLGTSWHARDIVKYEDRCVFYDGMYALDMTRPGAYDYYRSVLALYAEWGVDFIKADDMISWPQHYDEVLAFRHALDHCGRAMSLSLSPGAASIMERSFVNHTADMFRITGDLWDSWDQLKATFTACRAWKGYTGPGRWADCDMIPIGLINVRGEIGHGEHRDRFTTVERQSLMTLWAMFRSPLMLGCDLTRLDAETTALFTHPEILAINQHSVGNDEISSGPGHSIWSARSQGGDRRWLAVFNLSDEEQSIEVDLHGPSKEQPKTVHDVWNKLQIAVGGRMLRRRVDPHGVHLLRIDHG